MNNKINFIPLKNLCVKIIDCPHSSPKWKKKGIPVIRNYNLKDGHIDFSNMSYVDEETYTKRIKRANPEYKDIVVSREAPMGTAAIIPSNFKCCMGQRLVLLKVDKNICIPEYLLCAIQSQFVQAQIKIINKTGSVVSNLNISDLEQIVIPMMPMNEQSKIVEIYNSISDKIFNNNAILSELQSLAKTIYDYWFLQFDFPDENGNPYRSSGGKMVWNDKLKREIPEGWKVKQLCSICDFIMGQSPKGKSYNVNGIGYPLINGAVELNKNGITINKYTDEANRISSVGDWLFCIRATIGNVQMSDKQYALGRGVAGAHPKNKKYTEYLYMIIIQMCDYFSKILVGSIITGMTKDDILNYPVIIPSEETISEFHTILSNSFIKKECLKQENQELASLRDFLLPLLTNGQVTFKED